MKALQYACDELGQFKEELKQGSYGFFELTENGVRTLKVMEATELIHAGRKSVFAYSTLAMPFEYALYGVEFEKCPWPATLRLGLMGRIAPNDELGKVLRLEMNQHGVLTKEASEWFYDVLDATSRELNGWFHENAFDIDPTMIKNYGAKALLPKGEKTPFKEFLPSWFDCELSKVDFVAKPVDKNRPSEQMEQELQLERLCMKFALTPETLKEYASRHPLVEAEKWMEKAHQLSEATAVTFSEAFQTLSKHRTLEEATRFVDEKKKQDDCRQAAQRLQTANPIAAKAPLEALTREISFRGEKAVLEKYAHDSENWKAATQLAAKIPQNTRSVELLYQEISTSGIDAVSAKYLPAKDNKGRLCRWGAIVAAVVLIIVIVLLCVMK